MRIKHLNSFFRIFLSNSPSIYYAETNYVSSSATLCYLVLQSVKLIGRQFPFLKGLGGECYDSPLCEPVSELSHGASVHGISPHVTAVLETSSQKSEEIMNSKNLNPSPNKKIKISFDDHFKKIPGDVSFSKQQENCWNFTKRKVAKSEIQADSDKNASRRPNYFVAVQISNPQIHERIKDIQQHILIQDNRFDESMISVPTLHITLMVLNISDAETHERAMKALANVHKEYNKVICKNPMMLEFCGLGHFNDKVLFAKIKENESYGRLHQLANSVRKHFAEFQIFSTDERNFNPHLTIAKIKFSNKKQRALKKIKPSLYKEFIDNHFGSANIRSLQLLRMTGPKDSSGYYTGDELLFRLPSASSTSDQIIPDISQQKKQIKEKIAAATNKALKQAFNIQRTSDLKTS